MADNNTSYQSNDEVRPVVWSPEDASRFLTSAIHEAQRPLADALKQRPVTAKALTLIVVILVAAAAIIAWILSSQLGKTERIAERALTARDEAMAQRMELQARMTSLEGRLQSAESQQEKLLAESNELRKTKGDIQRYRRQNELLKSQITGLEMEKMALARQLEAVRAMALEDLDGDEATTDPAPIEEPAENTQTAPPPTEASTEASVTAGTDREAPPAGEPAKVEIETPATESAPASTPSPGTNESAAAVPAIGVTATGSQVETDAATIEPAERVELTTERTRPEDAAITITANPAPATGKLPSVITDNDPPTLYESFEQSAKEYGGRLSEKVRPDEPADAATTVVPEDTDKAAVPEEKDKYSETLKESTAPEEPADDAATIPEEPANVATTDEPTATEEEGESEEESETDNGGTVVNEENMRHER